MSIAEARAVADAVLYEGYLLYPYRASAAKNRSRWQFGVLGPPGADPAAYAEAPAMSMQCLLAPGDGAATVTLHLRFLQLQAREVQRLLPDGSHQPVAELTVAGTALLSWDEAVEREIVPPAVPLEGTASVAVEIPGGQDVEAVTDAVGATRGRIVRRRWALTARLLTRVDADGDLLRLTVAVTNAHPGTVAGKEAAIRRSLLGTHLLIEAHGARFVSLLEPPLGAAGPAARCRQHRCWPVLAGPPGAADVVLGAPIILYDHPRIASQSPGALFDSTEIDEILTLRVMTMTDAEKAEARATDPRAAEIVDRCDAMSAAGLSDLHGARLDPSPRRGSGADDPGGGTVVVGGVPVARGSLVRVHPNRRADAQDLFFAGRVGRVTGVLTDIDGGVHVALVLVDDPAADLHDWYGRSFHFAPDELEPLSPGREENRS